MTFGKTLNNGKNLSLSGEINIDEILTEDSQFSLWSETLVYPLLWFLCDSSSSKLFEQWSWNSTQRNLPWLIWLPKNKILEKSQGSSSDVKHFFFYVLAWNYISDNRNIMKFCASSHYQSSNNTQWFKNP